MDINVKNEVVEEMTPARSEYKFVKFRYKSEDAMKRRKVIEQALETIEKTINETGGDMPFDLANKYEDLNDVMIAIVAGENDVIRTGI